MAEEVLIGSRLRVARLSKGLTLGAIATTTGLTPGYLSKLERDQVSPSVASLVAVCAAVGLRVGDLFQYALDCDIEFIFVVSGTLELITGEEVFSLGAGDAMTMRGRESHTWRNESAVEACEVLWMLAPAP